MRGNKINNSDLFTSAAIVFVREPLSSFDGLTIT